MQHVVFIDIITQYFPSIQNSWDSIHISILVIESKRQFTKISEFKQYPVQNKMCVIMVDR